MINSKQGIDKSIPREMPLPTYSDVLQLDHTNPQLHRDTDLHNNTQVPKNPQKCLQVQPAN